MTENQDKVHEVSEAEYALDIFYKILTGHSMNDEENPTIKEHFILKCKEIVLEVIKMRAQTATSVINGNLNLKQVKQLYEDAVNKINNYETSKEE
jgi:hypothetical protein